MALGYKFDHLYTTKNFRRDITRGMKILVRRRKLNDYNRPGVSVNNTYIKQLNHVIIKYIWCANNLFCESLHIYIYLKLEADLDSWSAKIWNMATIRQNSWSVRKHWNCPTSTLILTKPQSSERLATLNIMGLHVFDVDEKKSFRAAKNWANPVSGLLTLQFPAG